ncbi:MAG: hypothetical protein INH41_16230 [Myxococcaceae bacterium]|jgi:hypothetical protein|nr:hypothetical protein [Myxococcaceae bacterium]MCA3013929.1 hypothetical protein [Myxococcaceae bacterium]
MPDVAAADAGVGDGGSGEVDGGDAGPAAPDRGRWRIRWTQSADFPTIIDHHTTFVGRSLSVPGTSALYVIGGQVTQTEELFDTIYAAGILPDGGLGPWAQVGTLPRPRAFHGIAANTGDGTYLAGGITDGPSGAGALGEVSRLVILNDMTLSTDGYSFFNQAALHPTFDSVRDQLVMVGGSGAAGPLTSVWTVSQKVDAFGMQPDGGFAAVAAQAARLPIARSHHLSVVYRGHLYLLGGFTTGDLPLSVIHRSRHDDAGIIVGWDEAGTMPDPPWTHSGFVHDDAVFVVGGGSFGATTWLQRIRRAPFLADGGVGVFEDVLDGLPVGRAHVHQTPFHQGLIYTVGGRAELPRGGFGSIERVDIGRLERE